MRWMTTALICFACCPYLFGETPAKQVRITERVFEIDRLALVGESQKPPEGVVDVRTLLSSKSPVILKETTKIQIGDSAYRLTETIKGKKNRSSIFTWGSVSFRSNSGKQNLTTTHGIGTEICFLDVSRLNGLLPMVGVYRVDGNGAKRLEGQSTTFVHAMIRMLPIEIRYPKKDEVVEEFAFPISTVGKILTNDPSMRGFLTGNQESNQRDPGGIDVSLHGLEFSFTYSIDDDSTVSLSQYRYLLSQIVDREELPGLALNAGRPTIVVDGDTVDIEFSKDELVAIHLTSEQERNGGNPLLLVLTAEAVESRP